MTVILLCWMNAWYETLLPSSSVVGCVPPSSVSIVPVLTLFCLLPPATISLWSGSELIGVRSRKKYVSLPSKHRLCLVAVALALEKQLLTLDHARQPSALPVFGASCERALNSVWWNLNCSVFKASDWMQSVSDLQFSLAAQVTCAGVRFSSVMSLGVLKNSFVSPL